MGRLDEPTSGLHLADLEQLLGLVDRLVDSGKSAGAEHHPLEAKGDEPVGVPDGPICSGRSAQRSS